MKAQYYIPLILIFLVSCGKDDIDPKEESEKYPVSYAQFHILGPTQNGDYEYKDRSDDDEYTTVGRLYTKAEDPDLPGDQIQLNIRKSYTDSNFFIVAPSKTGLHNITYLGGANDFDISMILSADEDYYAKDVSLNILELEMDGKSVVHCKGTFSGEFYRNNLVESDVHQINGAFEVNR